PPGTRTVTEVAQMRDFSVTDTGGAAPSLVTIAAGRRLGEPGWTQALPQRRADCGLERRWIVRGDIEVLEREARDVTEGRRSHDAAEDLTARLVDRHEDDESRS